MDTQHRLVGVSCRITPNHLGAVITKSQQEPISQPENPEQESTESVVLELEGSSGKPTKRNRSK